MYKNIALLVISCDKYQDLWEAYLFFFHKYWPDCPFDKYFVTNHLTVNDKSFKTINVDEDISWTDNIIKAISELDDKYDYVLTFLEDLFLSSPVSNKLLFETIEDFKNQNGSYIKLIKNQKSNKKVTKNISLIKSGALYRSTCVFALWKKTDLLNLLYPGENAWQFERNGSVRSDKFDNFFLVNRTIFKHIHLVIKGKILPDAEKWINNQGYNFKKNRKVFSKKEFIKYKIYKILRNCFWYFIPLRYSREVNNLLTGNKKYS